MPGVQGSSQASERPTPEHEKYRKPRRPAGLPGKLCNRSSLKDSDCLWSHRTQTSLVPGVEAEREGAITLGCLISCQRTLGWIPKLKSKDAQERWSTWLLSVLTASWQFQIKNAISFSWGDSLGQTSSHQAF